MRIDSKSWGVRVLTVASMLLSTAAHLAGQSTLVDQGTFEVSIDGRPAGTESFTIRRAGVGPNAQTIATGEISLSAPEGRLELRPALQVVGRGLALSAYQTKISGARDEEVFVTVAVDRFLLRMISSRGEQERELRAVPGTLVLDADVAHQYHFVSQRLATSAPPLPVIIPREGRQAQIVSVESSEETIRIGGQAVESTHLLLSVDSGTRDLWVDAEGRVLRVTDRSSGYAAARTALPGVGP